MAANSYGNFGAFKFDFLRLETNWLRYVLKKINKFVFTKIELPTRFLLRCQLMWQMWPTRLARTLNTFSIISVDQIQIKRLIIHGKSHRKSRQASISSMKSYLTARIFLWRSTKTHWISWRPRKAIRMHSSITNGKTTPIMRLNFMKQKEPVMPLISAQWLSKSFFFSLSYLNCLKEFFYFIRYAEELNRTFPGHTLY